MFTHPKMNHRELIAWTVANRRLEYPPGAHFAYSNFGFCLSVWDRLFRTYRATPGAGHEGMVIGLPIFRDPAELRIDRLITHCTR